MRELAEHTGHIRDRHLSLTATAVVLASPVADSSRRATARALADAGDDAAQALSSISRALAMSARLHEVASLSGLRADSVRERAGRELNLALSRARLSLTEASDALRDQARSGRDTAALPAVRNRAAIARSSATPSAPSPTAPTASAPASSPLAAAHRR
ncbi:hypothetical protein [Kitasatospora sp. NPDC098663]|uniref:hypothetical protein n=1 Tax=Kitasatospora sp. NPDC098663 TaxID=3364096 RepID=UPI00382FDECA